MFLYRVIGEGGSNRNVGVDGMFSGEIGFFFFRDSEWL